MGLLDTKQNTLKLKPSWMLIMLLQSKPRSQPQGQFNRHKMQEAIKQTIGAGSNVDTKCQAIIYFARKIISIKNYSRKF